MRIYIIFVEERNRLIILPSDCLAETPSSSAERKNSFTSVTMTHIINAEGRWYYSCSSNGRVTAHAPHIINTFATCTYK
jgi:hypothetical protein